MSSISQFQTNPPPTDGIVNSTNYNGGGSTTITYTPTYAAECSLYYLLTGDDGSSISINGGAFIGPLSTSGSIIIYVAAGQTLTIVINAEGNLLLTSRGIYP